MATTKKPMKSPIPTQPSTVNPQIAEMIRQKLRESAQRTLGNSMAFRGMPRPQMPQKPYSPPPMPMRPGQTLPVPGLSGQGYGTPQTSPPQEIPQMPFGRRQSLLNPPKIGPGNMPSYQENPPLAYGLSPDEIAKLREILNSVDVMGSKWKSKIQKKK